MPLIHTQRFQLIRKLGEGGMGIVYEAYDRVRDMRVALKHLPKVEPKRLYWFKREFRALSSITHPNIITHYELVSEGDQWFLTMELVDGVDFATYVASSHEQGSSEVAPDWPTVVVRTPVSDEFVSSTAVSDDTVPGRWCDDDPTTDLTIVQEREDAQPTTELDHTQIADDVLGEAQTARIGVESFTDLHRLQRVLGQLAQALYIVHSAGLSHRDLKPSNVLVTAEGRLVLMDFGIVADLDKPPNRGFEGGAVGTPRYMAPEQVRGVPASAASDWYAFGTMLYHCLTGRHPYEGDPMRILRIKQIADPIAPSLTVKGVPPHLERLCLALLSRVPGRRPSGARVLATLGVEIPVQAHGVRQADAVFVGRRAELRALYDAYATALAGDTNFTLVEGVSGIGKTRLTEQFVRELESDDVGHPLVLAGRCHERESLPYKALDGVIDCLSLYLLELPPHRRSALFPANVHLLGKIFPVLSRSIPQSAAPATSGRDPLELRTRATTALRALLQILAKERPIVIRIDDLQWVDTDSVELLKQLLAPPWPNRLMIVATVRSENLDNGQAGNLTNLLQHLEALPLCRRVRLGPLSLAEQRELVYKLSFDDAQADRMADPALQEWTGHPMLLTELIRYLPERLEQLRTTDSFDLAEVLWSRIVQLPDSARRLLELLAITEQLIPIRLLARAGDFTDAERERACDVLRKANLARIVRSNGEPLWDMYHAKVREAIVAKLAPDYTAVLHQRVALTLESWPPAPAATIAHHWIAAGDYCRGARYTIEAADRASYQLAFKHAAELYRQALDLLPDEAAGAELDHIRCRARLGLAQWMRLVGRQDEALEHLEQAEPLAARHELVEERAAIHYLRGSLLYPRGDVDGCLTEHQMARSFAKLAGSHELQAQALCGLGDAYFMRGQMSLAHDHYHACVAICNEHGFSDIEPASLSMRGFTLYFTGDLASARRDCSSAIMHAVAVGNQRAEILTHIVVGQILVDMARYDESRAEYELSLELAQSLGALRFEGHSLIGLGNVLLLDGRPRKACELLTRGIALCRDTGFAYIGPMGLGLLAYATPDPEIRRTCLTEGEQVLRDGAVFFNYLYFYRYAIEAALQVDDFEGVDRYARRLEEATRLEPLAWSEFYVARARALAKHRQGHIDGPLCTELRRLHTRALALGFDWAALAIVEALNQSGSR